MFKVAKWYKIFSIAIVVGNLIAAIWNRNVAAAAGWSVSLILMFMLIRFEMAVYKILK